MWGWLPSTPPWCNFENVTRIDPSIAPMEVYRSLIDEDHEGLYRRDCLPEL